MRHRRKWSSTQKHIDAGLSGSNPSIPLDISSLYNNRGFRMQPGDANLDDLGNSYLAQYLPPPSFVYDGINFIFLQYKASGNDNVLTLG